MSTFEVVLYEKANGQCPVEDFINGLPKKEQAKLLRDIELLEMLGTKAREPLVKTLKGEKNLFELRSIFSSNAQRVFYFLFQENRLVLLNGFTKKTNKTPSGEIIRAKQYKEDYIARNSE